MAKRSCKRDGCRNEPKTSRAQYCDDLECERARARLRRRVSNRKQAEEQLPDDVPEGAGAGGVFSATLSALTTAGRVATPAGQNALALATRIDHGATDSGSSIAALSKQHLAALDEALKNLEQVGDPIDELGARRRARSA